ncbi:hypothetical protein ACOSQ4_027538 [Xanthoceras sorbifolium]
MPVEIGEIAAESSSTVAVAVPILEETSLVEADPYINLDGKQIVIENGVNMAQSSPHGIAVDDYFTPDDLNNLLCFNDAAFFNDSNHQLPWL